MTRSNKAQHIIVYLLLFVGILCGMFYRTDLEKLLEKQAIQSKEYVGIREINTGADKIVLQDLLVPDVYNVLYFYSNSCPACRRLSADLEQFSDARPDVAVLKFNLGYDWSADDAYNRYKLKIGKTPFIHIYDSSGNVIAKDDGYEKEGLHLLKKWAELELNKVWR